MPSNETVYIIDDDQGDRESLQTLLNSVDFSARSYASARDFLDDYDGVSSGCVVTDYRMKEIDGLELQKRILAEKWELPVIVISGYADVPMAVEAMQHGALTLLEKPYDDRELFEAVKQGTKINAKWRRRRALQKSIQQRINSLTSKEQQVLSLLLKGMPNKQISARLDVSLRTVERRRNALLQKMQAKNVASIARLLTFLDSHLSPIPNLRCRQFPEITSK